MNIVDDWTVYPILSSNGRWCWSERGYRWLPLWLAHPLMRVKFAINHAKDLLKPDNGR